MTDTGSLDLTDTPIVVPLDLPSENYEEVSFANHAIVVAEAGVYRIDVTLSGRSLNTSSIVLQLAVNNVAQAHTTQAHEFAVMQLTAFVFSNFWIWMPVTRSVF